jgi:hypothetical protein
MDFGIVKILKGMIYTPCIKTNKIGAKLKVVLGKVGHLAHVH